MLGLMGFAAVPMAAHAAPAFRLNNVRSDQVGTSEETRGFIFSTDVSIDVTALGWFDEGSNGLANRHRVGIWSTGGTELINGAVSKGATDPITGGFRYTTALTGSTDLAAGTYYIGGLSTDSDKTVRDLNANQATFASDITFGGSVSNNDIGVFSFPGSTTPEFNIGYFGANFEFTRVASVPEPATMALLTAGLLGTMIARGRPRRDANRPA